MTHQYTVLGMTCAGCAETVRKALSRVPGISSVQVDLEQQEATIVMDEHVPTSTLQDALRATKYSIFEGTPKAAEPATAFQTYRPIFLIFGYITGITLLIAFLEPRFDIELWMSHFMAAFFLTFSFFKLLDVPAFAMSYSSYDIIAKRWLAYGYIYPFIELLLGVLFLIPSMHVVANVATLVVMSLSIVGVLESVIKKRKIQCACLGAVFNLPMSTVTVIEDALMILMSAASLLLLR